MPRKSGWRAPSTFAGTELAAVVANLRTAHAGLVLQRRTVDSQIVAIEKAMNALVFAPAARPSVSAGKSGRGGPRGIRPGSLTDRIRHVLSTSGTPMRVVEITDAVRKSGFKTKNKTLDKSVGLSVRKIPGVVRIGRGVFRMN